MNSKKILIIRFHAIGDVAMSTIIPYAIKSKYDSCEIHYLTSSLNAKFLKNCSYIDKIIPFDGDIIKTLCELFKQRYDCIMSLNYTLKSYIFTFLSFPKKIIFKSFKGDSWVENYFYTAKKIFKDINLPNRLYLSNKDSLCENRILKEIEKYPKPYILFNPGRYENQIRQGRVWNIEKWKELSEKILKEYGGTIFVNGNMKERDYHLQLSNNRVIVFSGLFSIEDSCVLISSCDLVITGDSGPCHIASAYNKKTIAILGSTSPDKIKPYGENGYYIEPANNCRYCWKKKCKYLKNNSGYAPCTESITPDMVMKKISDYDLLDKDAYIGHG